MAVRMQPRTEALQHCRSFALALQPHAHIFGTYDHQGNAIHHFNIPAPHQQLVITANALVEVQSPAPLPQTLGLDAWARLDALVAQGDHWNVLAPGPRTQPSALLASLSRELNVTRRDDPLSLLREINTHISALFAYAPRSTRVDSPIDDALRQRAGVCQDFAHIMSALVRPLMIPCRYVSGYLYHHIEDQDRSAQDATHAWVEALLPELGWVGFDPTNNLIAGKRHIRVAVGSDYTDVPPTQGIYKGPREHELQVAVRVALAGSNPDEAEVRPFTQRFATPASEREDQQQPQ